jgi:hypothetical protein
MGTKRTRQPRRRMSGFGREWWTFSLRGSTRTFDGLGLCRKSAYVPVEHIGGRIDMKRHEFIRLSGGGLVQYRALIAEWNDGKCWSAVSAD